jgi:cysteine sulfinate desulfinase/cysteine desulfurase-like protein/anaerobic selenocysteine-containing dehydrogenase
MICTNGSRSADIVYDPKRLRTPMRRVGPKGSFEFEPISWDEAFETIVAQLQQIKLESGPEATAIYTGRGSFELSMCDLFQPADVAVSSASSVLFPFGSPNTLGVGALCYVSFAMIAPHVTLGEMYISMDTDIDEAELVVVWGANPATDSPPTNHERILAARDRGAEIVVIDPRRSETAKQSGGEWLPLRPGTDGALALSMIHVLVEEELYDEDFVANWTLGWDELCQYVQHFRPEIVEDITGVPADRIRRLARSIATARGACPVMYTGLEYSDSGVQAIRAVLTLWAIAGQLDVPGGLNIRMRGNQFPINREGLVANPDMKKALGRDRFPVYSMYRGESHAIALPQSVLEGDPYKIRSLIVLGGSISTAWPNPELWRKTFDALDFMVCIDRHLTADAAYADIVLPATTMYEIDSYMVYGPRFVLRERMIDPVGEARDDFFILAELARRLGYGELYPQDDEGRLRLALEGSGFTLEDVRAAGGEVSIKAEMMQYKKWEKGLLREDGKPGFDTPTGKFEIASTILGEHGYNPLPVYTEPREGPLARPDLAERHPLVFNSGARIFADFRSQHHGVASLAALAPDPRVTMNDEDARERGITDGDWVWVETTRGRVKFRAQVTDEIVRGAIDANMGGGGPLGPESWQNCNVNDLTDLQAYDPISGFPTYKALLCEVVHAEPGKARRLESTDSAPTERVRVAAQAAKSRPHREVYLDNNATTDLAEEVLDAMIPFLRERSGNPSSIHTRGTVAREAVEAARRGIAQALNCTARRIVFTGGGSESDNLAIKGASLARRERDGEDRARHVITSAVEHPAVLAACRGLERFGFEVTILDVNDKGRVSPDALRAALRPDTALVSIMLANNELGTIQPVRELAAIAHEAGALFHCDAVQGFGKIPVDVDGLDVDLLSISAHKLHGPKGIGALYVRKGLELVAQVEGGQQERGLRAGTENVPGIVGFGKACDLSMRALHAGRFEEVARLRNRLEAGIVAAVPGTIINGDREQRTPNTTNLSLPDVRGESLVLQLDRRGIRFSSGSACKSGNPDPSHERTGPSGYRSDSKPPPRPSTTPWRSSARSCAVAASAYASWVAVRKETRSQNPPSIVEGGARERGNIHLPPQFTPALTRSFGRSREASQTRTAHRSVHRRPRSHVLWPSWQL